MADKALAGRIAIVTGSGRGLGRAMAEGLADAGARVVITDVDADVVAESVEMIRARYGREAATGVAQDLSAEGAPESLVARTIADLGGLHIVVNNAGIGPQVVGPDFLTKPPKLWEIPPNIWRQTFAVNAHLPFFMACAAVPRFLKQGWGRVINVTTSLDTMLRTGCGAYGSSKAANEAHASILSQDVAGTGVTVNVLVPGGPANTRMIPAAAPIKREDLIQPDVMVAPLVWLASDAASNVNGRRFIAAQWNSKIPACEAAEAAGAPIAWPQLAGSIWPGGKRQ
jgi:NAD(P)-dependent dehydrogenase (short-subunit alcohol dehydrogenase family)